MEYGVFERFIDQEQPLELAATVSDRTSHLSFFEFDKHDEFLRLVDMGEEALPTLFEALEFDVDDGWICFFAIGKIADDLRIPKIPMPEGALGEYTMNYELIRQAFLDYGEEQGIIELHKKPAGA